MRSKLKAVILLLLGVAVVLGGLIAERAVFNSSLGVQVGVGVVVAVIFIAAVVFSIVSAVSARRRKKEGEAEGTVLSLSDLRVGMILAAALVIVLGVVVAIVR